MISDEDLRPALDFAVVLAAARRVPGANEPAPPARLRQLAARRPLSKRALSEARRLVEDADEYRAFVAAKANPDVVGPVGMTWLQRPDGWEDTARSLLEASEADLGPDRRLERQRRAAERARDQALADLVDARSQLDRARADIAQLEAAVAELSERLGAAEREREAAHEAARAAKERAKQARAEQRDAEAERQRLAGLLSAAEEIRDRVLAERNAASDRRDASEREAAHAAGAPKRPTRGDERPRREALAIPGGLLGSSVEAAHHLVTRPGVLLVVDGYNVAKLGWPTLELADQRDRLLDAMEALTSRTGVEILVVFDGADVVAATGSRRLVRVEYSPAGVIADDVIRDRVAALPVDRPVIVATDDQELIRSLRRHGANVFASRQLLDLAVR